MTEEVTTINNPGQERSSPLLTGTERQAFLDNYLEFLKSANKAHYEQEKAFAEEFIDHPERFRPTARAVRRAFDVLTPTPNGACRIRQEKNPAFQIPSELIKNVRVTVAYEHSAKMGKNTAVRTIWAKVKQADGGWGEDKSSDPVSDLHNWVEKIPEEGELT
jgi:hypothetical protein